MTEPEGELRRHPPEEPAARCRLGNAWLDCLDMRQAVAAVVRLASQRGDGPRSIVITPNIQHIGLLGHDEELRQACDAAALMLPDGMPVAFTVSALVGRRQVRVTGSDLVPAVCRAAARQGLSIGILGGGPGVAREAAERLTAAHPGLQVTLLAAPERGFEHDNAALVTLLKTVREAAPAILLVALGTPKQEVFAHRHAAALGPGVALCVGAAIDFAAGLAPRAPRWLQRFGLEWLWRLAREPRRLGPRYATAAPAFLVVAVPALVRSATGRLLMRQRRRS